MYVVFYYKLLWFVSELPEKDILDMIIFRQFKCKLHLPDICSLNSFGCEKKFFIFVTE